MVLKVGVVVILGLVVFCGAGLSNKTMKHFFTISLCFLALSLSAQETITYPYNPDGDADGLVAVPDIQDLLAVYGSPFSPAEIMVGDTALSEWIQILYQALQDQQELINQLQNDNNALPDGILSGDILIWNGTAWMPEPPPLDDCGVYGGDDSSCAVRPITDDDIYQAVDLWLSNEYLADAVYGHISDWDVSNVTDMKYLFSDSDSFNDDISSWDVSSVTDMGNMFQNTPSFNGDLSSWDVSSVTDMVRMFKGAISFNGNISSWDVSNVTRIELMFYYASSFNGDISSWDVSSVTSSTNYMFYYASSFNGDLSAWDVSNVTDMSYMFLNASSFNGDLSAWDVSSVTAMDGMFNYAEALSEDNQCLIHTSFSSNSAWPYDWSGLCD
jgi:surface protein